MDLRASLPTSVRQHELRASRSAIAAGGFGAAACAYAGGYFVVDHGQVRGWIALLAGGFAALLMRIALRAKTAPEAGLRAFGFAVLFGAAVAALGVLGLFTAESSGPHDIGGLVVVMLFASVFGAAFGCVYGLPLAIFAVAVRRATLRGSCASDDRGVRRAGVFLVVCGGIAATLANEIWKDALAREPIVLAFLLAIAGIGMVVHAQLRLSARSRWVARARAGEVPGFVVRQPLATDDMEALAPVGDGGAVLEWNPEPRVVTYRNRARGTPLAIV